MKLGPPAPETNALSLDQLAGNLKTNFTKFEVSTIFHFQDNNNLYLPLGRLFPLKICQGCQLETKFQKSYCPFRILNKSFAAELLSKQKKRLRTAK